MNKITRFLPLGLAAALLGSATLIAGPIMSNPVEVPEPSLDESRPPWVPSVRLGYLHQFDTGLDDSGSFSVNRANIRAGISRVFTRDRTVGLSLGYGYDGYGFDDLAGDPWSDIHTLRLGLPIRWAFDDRWSLFAIPTVRSSAESGADFSDGISGGFLGGVSYTFGDHLTVGPGIGVLSQLEDDASIFPILIISWKITEALRLETGRGFGSSQGPGLMLSWQATDNWKFALGSRYEKMRFRLDDEGVAPGGIGQEKGIPVYLGASYATSRFSELSVYAGAKFGGALALDDRSGNRLSSHDHDTAPFAGITWKWGF